MNQHINLIITDIRTKNPKIDLKHFENATFYNGYFSGLDLTPDELSPSVYTEFRRRMKLAIDQIADTSKTLSILMFLLTPLTYFLGSLLRDLLIDVTSAYPISVEYIFIYSMWIFLFIFLPLGGAFLAYSEYRFLKDYLKLEFNAQSETVHNVSTIENSTSSKSHKKRLVELEDLLNENLISEDEYKLKKKEILKDL